MVASDVSQVFSGLEMLLTVVGNASLDSPRIKKVGNQDSRLEPRPCRIKVEDSSSEVHDALGRPAAAEHMKQIGVQRLVLHGVVAVEGGQALTRRGARYVLFAVVIEQVSNI